MWVLTLQMQETVCSTPGQAPRSQHQGLTQPQEQPSAEDPCTAIPRGARAGLPQQNNMEDALFIFWVVFACLYLFLKWVFIFKRSHPVKNSALSYRFLVQPRAHCTTHCTCLHPPAQPRAHWFNGFGKKEGCEAGINFLHAHGGCSCYLPQPGPNPIPQN